MTGRTMRTEGADSRTLLLELRRRGWSWAGIARAIGQTSQAAPSNLRKIVAGEVPGIRARDRLAELVAGDEPPPPRKPRQPRLFCRNGHPLTGDNLDLRPNGHRRCRVCSSIDSAGRQSVLRAQLPVRPAQTCWRGHPLPPDKAPGRGCDTCRNMARAAAASGIPLPTLRELNRCRRGHPFTPDNTHVDKRGWRRCLTCRRMTANREDRLMLATSLPETWWEDKFGSAELLVCGR